MISTAFIISLAWLTLADAQRVKLDPLIELSSPYSITPVDPVKAQFLQPGYIHEVKDCGGSGQLLQITNNNCFPALPAANCVTEMDKETEASIYFVAGEDASEVLVRATVTTTDGETKSDELYLPGTSLRAGWSYVMRITGKGESNLVGKVFTLRQEVLRASDKQVQSCSEIDFVGVKL